MKGLTSPEGILMLCVAGLLDLMGFIIFILGMWFGIDDYGILDAIGGVIIGLWLLSRHSSLGSEGDTKLEEDEEESEQEGKTSGQEVNPEWARYTPKEQAILTKQKTGEAKLPKSLHRPRDTVKKEAKELTKKVLKRFGLNFMVELIPFLGGIYPGWTVIVYKEMKE